MGYFGKALSPTSYLPVHVSMIIHVLSQAPSSRVRFQKFPFSRGCFFNEVLRPHNRYYMVFLLSARNENITIRNPVR